MSPAARDREKQGSAMTGAHRASPKIVRMLRSGSQKLREDRRRVVLSWEGTEGGQRRGARWRPKQGGGEKLDFGTVGH